MESRKGNSDVPATRVRRLEAAEQPLGHVRRAMIVGSQLIGLSLWHAGTYRCLDTRHYGAAHVLAFVREVGPLGDCW